jgi:hypothetical protein
LRFGFLIAAIVALPSLTGCSSAGDVGLPVSVQSVPDVVRPAGLPAVRLREPIPGSPYERESMESVGFPGEVRTGRLRYSAALASGDTLERIWVRTDRSQRVQCVAVQLNRPFFAVRDSLTALIGSAPTWQDSTRDLIQTVWADSYSRWAIGGYPHPRINGVLLFVTAVSPVGQPFDPQVFEAC